MQRFGVFRLGQIWSVISDNGRMTGFTSLPLALAAVDQLVAQARAYGAQSEVLIQDEAGRLISTGQPLQFVDVNGVPRGTIWDRLDD